MSGGICDCHDWGAASRKTSSYHAQESLFPLIPLQQRTIPLRVLVVLRLRNPTLLFDAKQILTLFKMRDNFWSYRVVIKIKIKETINIK